MPARATRRGKVAPLNNAVMDVFPPQKSSPIKTIIAEMENKRSRRNKKKNSTSDSFNKENEFVQLDIKIPATLKFDKQPDVIGNSVKPRRFTRSVMALPENNDTNETVIFDAGNKRKNKLTKVDENLTEVVPVTLPIRKMTRRNKQNHSSSESHDEESKTVTESSMDNTIINQELTKKKTNVNVGEAVHIDLNLPSKRGSTESSQVIELHTRTRNKMAKIVCDSKLPVQDTTKQLKVNKTTKQKKKNNTKTFDKNDVHKTVVDEDASGASDETSYHSANGSLDLLCTIDKEEFSFSPAVESHNNKNNSSLVNISSFSKHGIDDTLVNSETQNKSNQLNETYPIIPLDSSQPDCELLPKPTLLKSLKSKNLRISGIEEFEQPIVPVPVMQRQGTYVKETSFNISQSTNNISNNSSMDRTSRRKVLSASSPCKIFGERTTMNLDSFADIKTPLKPICQAVSVGSAGQTPMPLRKSSINSKDTSNTTPSKSSKVLNRTHSLEKPSKQNETLPNGTMVDSLAAKSRGRVAFCSPNRRQVSFAAHSGKIIKSSMKGSTKSFLLTDSLRPGSRKRSITQDNVREGKIRKMTAKDLNISAGRLSKPKTPISEAKSKLNGRSNIATRISTPAKLQPIKPAIPLSRSKMPDFASLHKKQFEQMESLVQNKVRKEERAKQLLFPTLPINSPKPNRQGPTMLFKDLPLIQKPVYTRFGYKVAQNGTDSVNENEKKTAVVILPRSAIKTRMTKSQMRNIIMREDPVSLVEKKRIENREYVKGIRTNRRFDLQMKSRNLAV